MECLFGYVLYHHSALLNHWEKPRQERLDEQKEICLWLSSELFYPVQGYPILGEIKNKNIHGKIAPGVVQQRAIRFLKHSKDIRSWESQISMEIVGIWYKNKREIIWKELIRTDERFFEIMKFSKSAFREKLRIEDPSDHFEVLQPKSSIGIRNCDFRGLGLTSHNRFDSKKHFPTLFLPDFFNEPELSALHENIYSELSAYYQFRKLNFTPQVKKKLVHGLLLKISPWHDYKRRKESYITILYKNSGHNVGQDDMKSYIREIIMISSNFHKTLMLKFTGFPSSEITNIYIEFLKWFSSVLFEASPYSRKIPIFYCYGSDDLVNKEKEEIFESVKIYLIQSFTNYKKRDGMINVGISLLGYWYQTEKPEIWNSYFSNDGESFWERAKELFGGILCEGTETQKKKLKT